MWNELKGTVKMNNIMAGTIILIVGWFLWNFWWFIAMSLGVGILGAGCYIVLSSILGALWNRPPTDAEAEAEAKKTKGQEEEAAKDDGKE